MCGGGGGWVHKGVEVVNGTVWLLVAGKLPGCMACRG